MRIANAFFIAMLLIAPAITQAYPLEDTQFLKAAYCFHMSNAPRLEVDLSGAEKEEGQKRFFEALRARNLKFPQGEDYKDILYKFAAWVVPRFQNVPTKAALDWYRMNCLSNVD